MEEIYDLELQEAVSIDPDRLVELCVQMGELKAEGVVAAAMENLAAGMLTLEVAFRRPDLEQMMIQAELLAQTARHVGMVTFARVAEDVRDCANVGQWVPLSATMARLHRIADRSLNAVWDMQDVSG